MSRLARQARKTGYAGGGSARTGRDWNRAEFEGQAGWTAAHAAPHCIVKHTRKSQSRIDLNRNEGTSVKPRQMRIAMSDARKKTTQSKMKTIHKFLLGLAGAAALATATPALAYHHGSYSYHHGHYGYYYGHHFYVYNSGPYPYYYGPWNGPGVVVSAPAPVVVVHPRRHVFFWF